MTRHPSDDRSERGFTLIEVIVALAVVALTLVALYEAIAGGIAGERMAAERTRVLALARSDLEKLGLEEPLKIGRHEKPFTDGLNRRVTVVPLIAGPAPATPAQGFEITYEMLDQQGTVLVRLVTIKLGFAQH